MTAIATNLTAARLTDAEAAALLAGTVVKTKKPALVELTPATVDPSKAILVLIVDPHRTLLLLPTVQGKEIYSAALQLDGKTIEVWPAHDDRVASPRCLPRAIRLLGSWLGEHSGDKFSNGAKPAAK